jgi:hypothetical protein
MRSSARPSDLETPFPGVRQMPSPAQFNVSTISGYADVCVEALNEAIHNVGPPENMNTDQGSQFTSFA